MTNGVKFVLAGSVIAVLALGGELLYLHHRNTADEKIAVQRKGEYAKPAYNEDDTVFLRKEHPDTLKDERDLIGKTIWVSAGGQMDYYHATGKHADYAHPVGTLRGAEPLVVRDVFEQVPPKTGPAVARIAAGDRHVLLAFTMPNSSDPKALYAVPVGHYLNGGYEFLTDEIFFYDDPHTLYKHWGPEMWAHIDKHEAVPGMSENQAMMALGQVIEPHGDTPGNRSITFNNNNHPVDIEFVDGKAVKVTPE